MLIVSKLYHWVDDMPEHSKLLPLMLSEQFYPRGSKNPQSATLCSHSEQSQLRVPVNTSCNGLNVNYKVSAYVEFFNDKVCFSKITG